jgi:1,4-alpha-glucan branching enzyme
MIQKTYYNEGRNCRVTFRVPADDSMESVHVAGEFNDWDPSAKPLARRRDGTYSTSLVLTPNQRYRFRYVVNGERWINDDQADDYVENVHGETDSVVEV